LDETSRSKIIAATPFSAATGDANGDMSVDVLDITTIVSYMLNENPHPFLFDAADVNYDNEINVLDIIGLVELINGNKKSMPLKPLPQYSKETAYYSIEEGKIILESKGNITALQFKMKLKGDHPDAARLLENIKIFSKQKGFEFAYKVTEDHLTGVLFSLTGKLLPEGVITLFEIKGNDLPAVEFSEIFGGDVSGNYVPVLKKGSEPRFNAGEAVLQVNPNPVKGQTRITYVIPESGEVSLSLYDLSGKQVNRFATGYRPAGVYNLNWNGTDAAKQQLKQGVYILRLNVQGEKGKNDHCESKIVLTR
jgi:hypothetical protein